jgi:hypothetical protein
MDLTGCWTSPRRPGGLARIAMTVVRAPPPVSAVKMGTCDYACWTSSASEVVQGGADLRCAGVVAEVFEDGLGLLP